MRPPLPWGRDAAILAKAPAWLPAMIARRGAGLPGGRGTNCRSFCRSNCRFFLFLAPTYGADWRIGRYPEKVAATHRAGSAQVKLATMIVVGRRFGPVRR